MPSAEAGLQGREAVGLLAHPQEKNVRVGIEAQGGGGRFGADGGERTRWRRRRSFLLRSSLPDFDLRSDHQHEIGLVRHGEDQT